MSIYIMVSLICDCCEKEISGYAFSEEDAQKLADEKGWVTFQNGQVHYCPDCKEKAETQEAKL